ncbi:hypothetical protein [Sharpea azabuensis]|uniref:hypothetical protein n=1 Tax=Sharpea azabuensis TaxID=322505 RepID=UPI00240A2F24|nr:hypothetical protein [Sharpea azabuensis]MDD6512797.1 hypothetical protein [Sharpea azabuensis]
MIDKETYKKELKRMFDSLSGGNKSTDRCGIKCSQCPLKKICNNNIYAFDIIEAVEKWSNENKYKVSKLEYDILKIYAERGFHGHFAEYGLLMALLRKGYFKGADGKMEIEYYFKNCEVKEDV